MARSNNSQQIASYVPQTKEVDDIELDIGDLVVFTGKVTEHNALLRRVIYMVAEKEPSNSPWAKFYYKYRIAFDFENPLGTKLDVTRYAGTHDLKKLTLLDVGMIRMMFDNFIKEWAHKSGDVTSSEDVEEEHEEVAESS